MYEYTMYTTQPWNLITKVVVYSQWVGTVQILFTDQILE